MRNSKPTWIIPVIDPEGRHLFVSVRAWTKFGAWWAYVWGQSVEDDRPLIDSTIRIGWPIPLDRFVDFHKRLT